MTNASTSPMRLDSDLVAYAKREGSIKKRSAPKQIEYWAELGKAIEQVLDYNDIIAVIQGLKKIKVESVQSVPVDPADVFSELEERRTIGKLADKVTFAAIYYEASRKRPGLLEKVNAATGERQIGQFRNGEFEIQ